MPVRHRLGRWAALGAARASRIKRPKPARADSRGPMEEDWGGAMSDLRMNSVFGAVLASVLGVLVVGTLADSFFAPDFPEKAGYLPEVAATPGAGAAAPQQEGPPDFGRLYADPAQYADLVARGQRATAVCGSCHTFDAGGANRIGPNLNNVFGRASASHGGFTYSEAMRGHGATWSYDTLDAFLRSPSQTVRGTSMAFAGVRNTDERVAVIAYLRSLAPNPPALPAPLPEPAPAASEEAAPADAAATPTPG